MFALHTTSKPSLKNVLAGVNCIVCMYTLFSAIYNLQVFGLNFFLNILVLLLFLTLPPFLSLSLYPYLSFSSHILIPFPLLTLLSLPLHHPSLSIILPSFLILSLYFRPYADRLDFAPFSLIEVTLMLELQQHR